MGLFKPSFGASGKGRRNAVTSSIDEIPNLEAGAGFAPANSGFADHRVGLLRHPARLEEL